MPELPEVETIRLQLDGALKGLRITGVEVLNKKSFIGEVREVRGVRVVGVRRRGKITIIELEGGVGLAIHLKLTGQLIYKEAKKQRSKEAKIENQNDGPFAITKLPNKYTRVIISFDNGGRLYFNDLRLFGWVRVIRDVREIGEGKLGPEAIDEESFTLEYFKNILAKSKKPIKLLLMDQEKLAGVGNIYANEALFKAGILPTRSGNSLNEEEIQRLRDSILSVLKEAIEHKGSSDKDEAYRQITGEKGEEQNHLQIYGKDGQKCPKCGGTIKRIKLGGRGTFFCSRCQK